MIGVLIVRFRTSVYMFSQDKIKPALKQVYIAFEWCLNNQLMNLCSLFETYPVAISVLASVTQFNLSQLV